MKNSAFQTVMGEYNLTGLFYNSISKVIPDYKCRPNGGEEIQGTRYEFPEFVVGDGTATVTLHHVVWASDSDLPELLWQTDRLVYVNSWDEALVILGERPEVLHRSKKSGMSLSRFISSLQQTGDYSSQIAGATAAILRKLNCKGEELSVAWLSGDDLVNWYADHDRESHSCMTGNHAEFVRCWSTNPSQIRLAVFSDDKGPIARCLCFRPSTTLEPLEDEVPFGPGWFFSRIYSVQSASRSNHDGVDRASVFMEKKGLGTVGLKGCNGVVPMTMTEYAPFVDRGAILYQTRHVGRRIYYITPGWDGDLGASWNTTENNQYGSAWGRTFEEDDCNCTCASCDEAFDEQDLTYVEDYGSVCDGCLEGDFYRCHDGAWRYTENVSRLVSTLYHITTPYGESGEDHLDVWCVSNEDLSRHRIVFVPAIVDSAGEEGYAPEDELVSVGEGRLPIWKQLVDAGKYQLVDKQLTVTDDGWTVEPCESEYVSLNLLTTVAHDNGASYQVKLKPDSFDWRETVLLTSEILKVEVLIDRSAFMYIRRGGTVSLYLRMGNDLILIDPCDPRRVVWTSNNNRYPVGSLVDTIPLLTLASHSFDLTVGGISYGTVMTLKYCTPGDGAFWSHYPYPSGYSIGITHSDSSVWLFMAHAQKFLPGRRDNRTSPPVYIDNKGNSIDSVFKTSCGLVFLINANRVIGLFNPLDNAVIVFSTQPRFGTVDEMVAFAQLTRTPSLFSIIDMYTNTPNRTEVIS